MRTEPRSAAIGSDPRERPERFEALVLPHLDRLLAFARRRVEEATDAEDLVQVACMRAWSSFDDLRDEARVRPWLYRILRSAISDFRERHGRRRQLVDMTRLDTIHEQLIAGEETDPLERLLARISGERVQDALRQIPEDFAVAVELHDIDGFRYREIAEITGVPIGTVMSRIYRGRKQLASLLAADARAAQEPLGGLGPARREKTDGQR